MIWISLIDILSTAKSVNMSFVLLTINSPMDLVSIQIFQFFFSTYSMCYCWYRLPSANSSTLIFIISTYYIHNDQKILPIFHQMEEAFAFRQFFIYITCVFCWFFRSTCPWTILDFAINSVTHFYHNCEEHLWKMNCSGSMNDLMSFMNIAQHMVHFSHFQIQCFQH